MSRHLLSPRPPRRNTSKLSVGYVRSVVSDMFRYAGDLRQNAVKRVQDSTAKDAVLFGLDVAANEYHRRKRLRIARRTGIAPPKRPRE